MYVEKKKEMLPIELNQIICIWIKYWITYKTDRTLIFRVKCIIKCVLSNMSCVWVWPLSFFFVDNQAVPIKVIVLMIILVWLVVEICIIFIMLGDQNLWFLTRKNVLRKIWWQRFYSKTWRYLNCLWRWRNNVNLSHVLGLKIFVMSLLGRIWNVGKIRILFILDLVLG